MVNKDAYQRENLNNVTHSTALQNCLITIVTTLFNRYRDLPSFPYEHWLKQDVISNRLQFPLSAMKITGQPQRKACKLNFYWKICGNFFSGPPLQGSKILRAPLFASGPPYKYLWTVPYRIIHKQNPFNIISRGVQGAPRRIFGWNNFVLKIVGIFDFFLSV